MTRKTSRRNFLKTSATVVAATSALTATTAVHAAGSDEIRIAMIGCGGRCNGAIRDRAQVGDNFKVVAVADAFESNAQNTADGLKKDAGKDGNPLNGKVDVADNIFYGLDAYKKAISVLKPGDQVVIATPPGFRPYHYKAAVDAGLHVFMEKPVCIDAPGYRLAMEANKIADEKNLKVCVGFQRRAEPHYYNWVEQIHGGKIGKIQFTRVYWNGGGIWCREREPGEDELHYQVKNWYHFIWACGDNIVEQHAHNIDIGNWIHSNGDVKNAHPVSANGQGGRIIRGGGDDDLMRQAPPFSERKAWDDWYQKNKGAFYRYGQASDSFFVEYSYKDGSKMFSQCRHIKGTQNNVSEHAYGTAGRTGGVGQLLDLEGKEIWKNSERAKKGPYQWEHDRLVDAIRNDKPQNDGWWAANSSFAAVLGREAVFTGREVQWDELVEKGRSYFPNGEITSWEQVAPVQPDANGFYETSVPVPGKHNPFARKEG